MRESLIAEKAAEYKSKVQKAQREAAEERARIAEEARQREQALLGTLTTVEASVHDQHDQLAELTSEDNLALDALLNFINGKITRRKRRAGSIITTVAILIDMALVGLAIAFPSPGVFAVLAIAILTTGTHLVGKLQQWTGFGEVTRETAEAMLWVEASHRGIDPKLRRVSLEFVDQQFVLAA